MREQFRKAAGTIVAMSLVVGAWAFSGWLYDDMAARNQAANAMPRYSDFLSQLDRGLISKIQIDGSLIRYGTSAMGGFPFHVMAPPPQYGYFRDSLYNRKTASGAPVYVEEKRPEQLTALGMFEKIFISFIPMMLMLGAFAFIARGSKTALTAWGGSRLREQKTGKVTFADVAGADEAKADLQDIVDHLRRPEKLQALGGKSPRGVMLVGPTGTGKTLLARAIAGEAGVPFFTISGSDFVELFVGVGAARVRSMFDHARKNAPCLVFVDEIDAIGGRREVAWGNEEREQTLNQLLVEMDGLENNNQGLILIAATNRPETLDPALTRPGRFDRQVVVPNPDLKGRLEILQIHTRFMPLASGADLAALAGKTPGFSGADLQNLANEAALHAARNNRSVVGTPDFDAALEKITLGSLRRSHIITPDEKAMVAVREAAKVIVSLLAPVPNTPQKASVLTYGTRTGAVMMTPPAYDRTSMALADMKTRLMVHMAPYVAERLVCGQDKATSATEHDIAAATGLAKQMVTRWGFSELGAIKLGEETSGQYLQRRDASYTYARNFSKQTAGDIDREVRKLLDEAKASAAGILENHRGALEEFARALAEKEVMDANEIRATIPGLFKPFSPSML